MKILTLVISVLLSGCVYQDLKAPVPEAYKPINQQFEEQEVKHGRGNSSRDSK